MLAIGCAIVDSKLFVARNRYKQLFVMRKIYLSQSKFALVDNDDYEELSKWKWSAQKNSSTFYALRSVQSPRGKRTVYMHRAIMSAQKNKQVDHINGDGLDNRRTNLRICTNAENGRNRGAQSNNTSGYKGVAWHKQHNRWQATLRVAGKLYHLGYFATAELAHNAYCKASQSYHADFGRTA